MAFLEDMIKGGWTAALAGVGVALAAPTVLPAVGSALRPLAKVLLKGGVVVYDAVKEGLAEAGEQVSDLVAEARAELAEGTPATAATAGMAAATETSRKERETDRKPTTARKEP